MSTILKSILCGESQTIHLTLSPDYDIANLDDIKLFFGSVEKTPELIEGNTYIVQLSSADTVRLKGNVPVMVIVKDANLGERKKSPGVLNFVATPDKHYSQAVSDASDIQLTVTITVSEMIVEATIGTVMRGKSAYQIWLDEGNEGTIEDYFEFLKGNPGNPGKTAYQSAVDGGYEGTEEEFNADLALVSGKENAGVAAGLVAQVIDEATETGDTLKKLEDRLKVAEQIIGDAAGDDNQIIDTIRELLAVFSNFPEGSDMATLLTAKVNTADIYNALDCIIAGKVLDARQGKVLSDAIVALAGVVAGKQDALGFTPENVANKKTGLSENSDEYYPTQKAVKTEVDFLKHRTKINLINSFK